MIKEDTHIVALTGLRGAAALCVVAFHCHTLLPSHPLPDLPFASGYVGVDVFFVLSGYMLSGLYPDLNILQTKSFFLRRAARILPLHVTVMCVLGIFTLLASYWQRPQPYYSSSTFIPVLFLVQVPLGISGWNDPAWSISVEMICYISLPFVMPMMQKARARVVPMLAAALLISDALLLSSYGPQGVWPATHQLSGWFPIIRAMLGFYAGGLLSRYITIDSIKTSPFLVPFGWRPMVVLGEISFSVYLIHQPVLGIGKRLDQYLTSHGMSLLLLPIVALLICLISFTTYRFVETPGRSFIRNLFRDRFRKRESIYSNRVFPSSTFAK